MLPLLKYPRTVAVPLLNQGMMSDPSLKEKANVESDLGLRSKMSSHELKTN